jgi:hypothetical protein
MMREVAYPTAGNILLEEFLIPMGITQYRLAKEIGVPQARIGEIVAGYRFTFIALLWHERCLLDWPANGLRYSYAA